MDPYFSQLAKIWWKELSLDERRFVLERAMAETGKASPHEAFNLWRVGKLPLPGKDCGPLGPPAQADTPEAAGTSPAIGPGSSESKPPVPTEELELLYNAALGDSEQSRVCRFLLFLLARKEDPTGFDGMKHIRAMDLRHSQAFNKVHDWWEAPTRFDLSLLGVIRRLEAKFPREDSR